jgi:acyl carrier protein
MTTEEVLAQVKQIFIEVLDEDDLEINEGTTADDVDEWDSLNHIQLVVAIEKYFKIRFNAAQIQGYNNVGEMCEGIADKL